MKKTTIALGAAALASLLACAGGMAWIVGLRSEIRDEVARDPAPLPRKVVVVDAGTAELPASPNDDPTVEALSEAEMSNAGPPGWGMVAAWEGRVIYTCAGLRLKGPTRLGVGGWVQDGVPTVDPAVVAPMRMRDDDPVWFVVEERPGAVAWARIREVGHVEAKLPASGLVAACRVVESPPSPVLGDPETLRQRLDDLDASSDAMRDAFRVETPAP